MILRWCPAVRSVIRADSPRGWIPPGVAEPLPGPPIQAVLSVAIAETPDAFILSWHSSAPAHWAMPSGRGERRFSSLSEAEAAAASLFGVTPLDWMEGQLPRGANAEYVQRALAKELAVEGVEPAELAGQGRFILPPSAIRALVPAASEIEVWKVFAADYGVVFDPGTAQYGLVEEGPERQPPVLIGLYGSFLAALAAQ